MAVVHPSSVHHRTSSISPAEQSSIDSRALRPEQVQPGAREPSQVHADVRSENVAGNQSSSSRRLSETATSARGTVVSGEGGSSSGVTAAETCTLVDSDSPAQTLTRRQLPRSSSPAASPSPPSASALQLPLPRSPRAPHLPPFPGPASAAAAKPPRSSETSVSASPAAKPFERRTSSGASPAGARGSSPQPAPHTPPPRSSPHSSSHSSPGTSPTTPPNALLPLPNALSRTPLRGPEASAGSGWGRQGKMGVGGAACAEEHDSAPATALFTPSLSPPPQKCARVSTSPGMRLALHPAQCPPGLKLKSACRGCGECGRGGGESKSKALLWGVSSLSQLQLILVFSALLLTASFLLSTRAIDLSAVDLIAAAAAAGSGGDDAGGNGEYGIGGSDPAKLLFVEGVGLGGGSWLLGGTGGGGEIGGRGKRGRGPWGRVSAGGGGAVGKVTRALVRGHDAEMAAMMAALDLSASEDLLVGGDMDEKELRQRIRLVEDEWEYFQEAPYRLIDEFWRDVFDAAYDELVARDPTVHEKAVEEIARLSGKFYDVRTVGSKLMLIPKGAAGAAVAEAGRGDEAAPDDSDAQEGTGGADAGEGGGTGADAQGEVEAEGGAGSGEEKAKRSKKIEQHEQGQGQKHSTTQQQDVGNERREGKKLEGQGSDGEQKDGTAERDSEVVQTVRLEQKAAERLIVLPVDTLVVQGQDTQGGEKRVQRQLEPNGSEGSEGEAQWQQLQQRLSQPQPQQQLLQQELVSREEEKQKGMKNLHEGGTLRSYGSGLGGETTEATVGAAAADDVGSDGGGGGGGRVELQGTGEEARPGEVGKTGLDQGREEPAEGREPLRRKRKGKRSKVIKQKTQEKSVKVKKVKKVKKQNRHKMTEQQGESA